MIDLKYEPQTMVYAPLMALNSIHNPGMIVQDDTTAIFELKDSAVKPEIFAGANNQGLQWSVKEGSAGTVVLTDSVGTRFECKGTAAGIVEFEVRTDSYLATSPQIQARVVAEKTVKMRVNIIKTPGLPTVVDTIAEVNAIVERVNVYWRQAGIKIELEPDNTPTAVPQDVLVTPLANGIFLLDVPLALFDGRTLDPAKDPLLEEAELQTLNNMNRSSVAHVVHIYSIHDEGGGVGFTHSGLGTNPAAAPPNTTPADLVRFDVYSIDTDQIFGGRHCILIDGDTPAGAPSSDWRKLAWAHELGHYFCLRHSVEFDTGIYSPLLMGTGLQNLMANAISYPTTEDVLLRQAEIARQSSFVE